MSVVPAAERRVTTTPNATMTTWASSTLGGSRVSLWTVEMPPGTRGPLHAFGDQVTWSITAGSGRLVTPDHPELVFGPGTTLVLEGGRMRQLVAGPDGFAAVVAALPSEVTTPDGGVVLAPWVA